MIERLLAFAPLRPWVVLPVAIDQDCRGGHLELLDWLLHDPLSPACRRGFFVSAPGETLAVCPAKGGFAGLLLVGYRGSNRSADGIASEIAPALPADLLRERQVVVLPPEPYEECLADAWCGGTDQLVEAFARHCPDAAGWHIEDWLRGLQ